MYIFLMNLIVSYLTMYILLRILSSLIVKMIYILLRNVIILTWSGLLHPDGDFSLNIKEIDKIC